ncbi:MAG: SpoIIE family protein phosphatase [Candidatus Krumholzibacteriota bacterium]
MGKPQGRSPVIMLVDDEPMVTQALAAILELETDYEVITCASGAESLERLAAGPVDVVVSDFLMPGMTGLELLAEVRRMDPEIPRLMLTGYADKENAIRAINEVGLFQYLEKPLDNEQFLLALKNALDHKGVREALHEKIKELDRILHQRNELSARDEEFRQEMDWARIVQAKFLPADVPRADPFSLSVVYRPAMAVGGDFYEFVSLAEGRLGIVVADSTGHGVQAALGTALLKFSTAGLAGEDLGPGEILSRMNEVLYRGLPREIPVAAAAAVVEPGAGRIRLVGAGLPYPLLVGEAGKVQIQPANGLLLGLVESAMYNPGNEVVLRPQAGDSLLLFSDGLSEAQNSSDEFYGEGRLLQDAADLAGTSGQDLPGTLADRALAFGIPEYRDDLTVVGITRNS